MQPEIEARSVGLTAQQVTAYSESVKTSNNHSRWTRRRQEMLQPESGPKARTRRRQEMLQPESGPKARIEARSVGLTAQQVTAYSESVQV
jgi:hypothetical protein